MTDTSLLAPLRFVITGHNKAWVAFQSAEEAQEYWDGLPKRNKKRGAARFFMRVEDDDVVPITSAWPEVLRDADPRKSKR